MGADRNFVNSGEMLKYCIDICRKSKEKGLRTALGGAISMDSKSFIEELVSKKLIDKFETRKVVYKKEAIKNISKEWKVSFKKIIRKRPLFLIGIKQ